MFLSSAPPGTPRRFETSMGEWETTHPGNETESGSKAEVQGDTRLLQSGVGDVIFSSIPETTTEVIAQGKFNDIISVVILIIVFAFYFQRRRFRRN